MHTRLLSDSNLVSHGAKDFALRQNSQRQVVVAGVRQPITVNCTDKRLTVHTERTPSTHTTLYRLDFFCLNTGLAKTLEPRSS